MATPSGGRHLEIVFGRAFLVALERGELERAQVFARAFLTNHSPGGGDAAAAVSAA